MDLKTRGRKAKTENGELSDIQLKRKEYYQKFRLKHKDALPPYYKKENARLGRPPKKVKIVVEPPKDDTLNESIDNIISLLNKLKN